MPTPVIRPVWIDIASPDVALTHAFYQRLFGWEIEVATDPAYGGYAIARIGGRDVAGIGPSRSAQQPVFWSVYLGTPDADGLAAAAVEAGATVVMPPFDVGDAGRMGVLRDPVGAFIGIWQGRTMPGFGATGPGSVCWVELSARDADRAVAFYTGLCGWSAGANPLPDGRIYHPLLAGGDAIGAAVEMHAGAPPHLPSYWMPYFAVTDTAASFATALEAGGRELLSPVPFAHGSLAIVADPHGAVLGLMSMREG
jgi:hypothetical protein